MTAYVYFIYEKTANAIKIGKANNIQQRLSDLQTSSPNELVCIHHIECDDEQHGFLVEKKLHSLFRNFHIRGEWYRYDKDIFTFLLKENENLFISKQTREPLRYQTLYGEETFDVQSHPRCYFYPELRADLMVSYEDSQKRTNPYRTMEYPTFGKQLLAPHSTKLNRVFISSRKHRENLDLKKYNESKKLEQSSNSLELFLDESL